MMNNIQVISHNKFENKKIKPYSSSANAFLQIQKNNKMTDRVCFTGRENNVKSFFTKILSGKSEFVKKFVNKVEELANIPYQRAKFSINSKIVKGDHVALANLYENNQPLVLKAIGKDFQKLDSFYDQLLSHYYLDKKDYDRAEEIAKKQINLRIENSGFDKSDTIFKFESLLHIYSKKHKGVELLDNFGREIENLEKKIGKDNPVLDKVYNTVCRSFFVDSSDLLQKEKFRKLLEKQLTLREKILGTEHPDTLDTLKRVLRYFNDDKEKFNFAREKAVQYNKNTLSEQEKFVSDLIE